MHTNCIQWHGIEVSIFSQIEYYLINNAIFFYFAVFSSWNFPFLTLLQSNASRRNVCRFCGVWLFSDIDINQRSHEYIFTDYYWSVYSAHSTHTHTVLRRRCIELNYYYCLLYGILCAIAKGIHVIVFWLALLPTLSFWCARLNEGGGDSTTKQ